MSYVLEATYRHGGGISLLRSKEDIARFVEDVLTAEGMYTAATVYAIDERTDADPDHELTIGADSDTGFGGVRYTGNDGTWYGRGGIVRESAVVFVYFGTPHEFPADGEVSLDLVRQAMWELLITEGKRPSCVEWQEG